MVGVDVRLDRVDERQIELGKNPQIAFDIVDNRIDDGGLARLSVGDDIRPAFRTVIDVLRFIYVQENGNGVRHDIASDSATRCLATAGRRIVRGAAERIYPWSTQERRRLPACQRRIACIMSRTGVCAG